MREDVIKNKVKNLIKLLGMGINEIVLDMKIGDTEFNSIELIEEIDQIILHIFEDDYDYYYEFDSLTIDEKKDVYNTLSVILN